MDIRVLGAAPSAPFLSARDLFETEFDLDLPVYVRVKDDPDERTWTGHTDDRHVLNISRQAATSAMGRELALHELSHMYRYERGHPSHRQSTEEALYLGLTGERVEQRKLTHCYQIANHMKDIYADDITLSVGPRNKLVAYLESGLASALADRPESVPPAWHQLSPASDPEITAVNAAFALALCERHGLIDREHTLYDLAHAAARDAPGIRFDRFNRHFRTLARDPGVSEFRKSLVEITREYCVPADVAAD